MLIGGVLTLNGMFSLAVFIDTYLRNKNAHERLTKVGYNIKKNNKKVLNFIKDYLLCFIPVVNIFKYLKNISKSNGQYANYRLKKYRKRKMLKKDSIEDIEPIIAQEEVNIEDMTLDEERSYYKNLSDNSHKTYEKLIKEHNIEGANKEKEMMEAIDQYYYQILEELDLDDLKFSKNKNIQRKLKRK